MGKVHEVIIRALKNTDGMPNEARAAIIATCLELADIGVIADVPVVESKPRLVLERRIIISPEEADEMPAPTSVIGRVGAQRATTSTMQALAAKLPMSLQVLPPGFTKPLVLHRSTKVIPKLGGGEDERMVKISFRAEAQNDPDAGPNILLDPGDFPPSVEEMIAEVEKQAGMVYSAERRTVEAVRPKAPNSFGELEADPSMTGEADEGMRLSRVGGSITGNHDFTPKQAS